jgi:hypothetical protein
MKSTGPILIGLAVALAAACGYKPAVQSDAAKQPAYVFPHEPHVDGEVACAECHRDIASATQLDPAVRHVRLPANPSKQDACSGCHDTDPEMKVPARAREYRVRFSHADHLKRVEDCRKCHQQLPERGDARPKTPPMAACTACHHHQLEFAQARCTPCHVDLKGYRPETAFRHEGNWLATHGQLARPSAESCAACHDQTYCVACHSSATAPTRLENIFPERVDRAFIHRGDYVSRHMIDAGAQPASCKRCHGSGFCESCHELQGLSKAFTGDLRRPTSHAQTDWVGPAGSRQRHGEAARRDITNCSGCHDQGADATCVGCHRVGGVAGARSPHPRSFLKAHDRGDIDDNAMCRACHPG